MAAYEQILSIENSVNPHSQCEIVKLKNKKDWEVIQYKCLDLRWVKKLGIP